MPNLLKQGTSVIKAGTNIPRYGRTLTLSGLYSPITSNISGPQGLGVDSANNRLFVNNASNITYYNLTTGAYIGTITTGTTYNSVNVCGAYLVACGASKVDFLPLTGGSALTVTNTVTVNSNNFCIYDPTTYASYSQGRIFVTSYANNSIAIIDYATKTLSTTITTFQGTFNHPYVIDIDINGNQLIVSNNGNSTLSILNLSNPTIGNPLIITDANSNGGLFLTVDVANNRLFAGGYSAAAFYVYALSNIGAGYYSTISKASMGTSGMNGCGLWVSGGKIFICNSISNSISIISNVFT